MNRPLTFKQSTTVLLGGVLLSASPAFAAQTLDTDTMIAGLLSSILYSALGIFMAILSFKIIDALTPGELAKDIAENNVALGVLTGLFMLGICIIIAAVLAS